MQRRTIGFFVSAAAAAAILLPVSARATGWTAAPVEVDIEIIAPTAGNGAYAARFCAGTNPGYAAEQAALDTSAASINGTNNGSTGVVCYDFKRNYSKNDATSGYIVAVEGYGMANAGATLLTNGTARGKAQLTVTVPNMGSQVGGATAERPIGGEDGWIELEVNPTGTHTLQASGPVKAGGYSKSEGYSSLMGEEGGAGTHISFFWSDPPE